MLAATFLDPAQSAFMDMQHKYENISPTQSNFGFDLSGPNNAYGDPDLYLDTANGSPTQSSESPYQNVPFFQDYIASEVYPSPEVEAESPASEGLYQQHHVKQEHMLSDLNMKEEPLQPAANSLVGATPSTTSASSATVTPAAKAPAKRKRENRYKNAPASVLSRRRAQNRASQRAYRERKDQRIKDLEQMLEDSQKKSHGLHSMLQTSQNEISKLKGHIASLASSPVTSALGHAHIQAQAQAHHQQQHQQLQHQQLQQHQQHQQLQQHQQHQQQHIQMHPQHPQHHRHSSSAASHASHISQLSVASSMSVSTSSSAAPTPGIAAPLVSGFDPTTAGTMGMTNQDQIDSMFLYAQMGTAYTA